MISIIDDFVAKQTQDIVEHFLLADNVQWYYISQSSGDSQDYETYGGVNHLQYYHVIYNESLSNPVESPQMFHNILPLTMALPFYFKSIVRIKINATHQINSMNEDDTGPAHVDYKGYPLSQEEQMVTGIYYPHDSDGDTRIFKTVSNYISIAPKKGRMVLFDSSLMHSGTVPRISNRRIVVNFNVITTKQNWNTYLEEKNNV